MRPFRYSTRRRSTRARPWTSRWPDRVEQLIALRILSGTRRGSSRPILADTSDGPKIVKLRGAAQGTGPLIAETVVAEVAERLGFRVPARCLVRLDPGLPVLDAADQFSDSLPTSLRTNRGFVSPA